MPEITRFGPGKASNNTGGDGVTWFDIVYSQITGMPVISSDVSPKGPACDISLLPRFCTSPFSLTFPFQTYPLTTVEFSIESTPEQPGYNEILQWH
jgi:hypothetical protein